MGILSHSHVGARSHRLLLLTVLAAVLYLAAGLGLADVAGFGDVWRAAQHPQWQWLAASLGGVALAFVGYYFGYCGVGSVEDGPDDLSHAERLGVVAAGFGGFFAHGGTGIDRAVMRAAGGSAREAKVRVTLLGGLEHGILAIPCSTAAHPGPPPSWEPSATASSRSGYRSRSRSSCSLACAGSSRSRRTPTLPPQPSGRHGRAPRRRRCSAPPRAIRPRSSRRPRAPGTCRRAPSRGD